MACCAPNKFMYMYMELFKWQYVFSKKCAKLGYTFIERKMSHLKKCLLQFLIARNFSYDSVSFRR